MTDDGKGGGRRKRGKKGEGRGKNDAENGGVSAATTPHGSPRGLTWNQIPADQKCCIKHLWGKCLNPAGECKFGPHVARPSPAVMRHNFYLSMREEHGPPTIIDAAAPAEAQK